MSNGVCKSSGTTTTNTRSVAFQATDTAGNALSSARPTLAEKNPITSRKLKKNIIKQRAAKNTQQIAGIYSKKH